VITVLGGCLVLVLLYYGAEFLVKGGASIALKMKISPLVIGLTLVAYATSAPELVVSVDAAVKGLGDVSMGNVVGSNICNIALTLGLCSVITPLKVNANLLKFDVWVMMLSALTLFVCYYLTGGVDRVWAVGFFSCCILYTLWSIYSSKRENATEDKPQQKIYNIYFAVALALLGLAFLVCGAKLFVSAAIFIAKAVGVSDAVIGLTVVAVGTGLPELATSVVAAIKKQQDIAIGNVIGSNIFNILAILGIAPLVSPIATKDISCLDMCLMLGVSVSLYPLMRTGMRINRLEGMLLLFIYIGYTAYLIY
jgi:cation:H+ antiporter